MKTIIKSAVLLALLAVGAGFAVGQRTFDVDDFSDRYRAKVFLANPSEVFSPGWIAIYDKRTKRQIIKVSSDELTTNLHDGKIVSNIQELPYGEQSLILFEDYNFDGLKDLALMDGQNSCYHGPSYKVYLATRTGFTPSPAFTRLAQEYCGMFNVDAKERRIRTMTKSGCCWHQYSDFVVENNRPVAVRILEEGMGTNGLTWDYTEQLRVNGKMQTRKYSLFDEEDLEGTILFTLEFTNKKKMWLIDQRGLLHYLFTDKDSKVELAFSDAFSFSKQDNALRFTNAGTVYEVTPTGIMVDPAGKRFDMDATSGTRTGSFDKLSDGSFENVIFQ